MTKISINKLAEQKPTLLIDGDIFLYIVACAVEKEVDFGELTVLYSDKEEIFNAFNDKITSFKKKFNTNKVIIAFSDRKNFRKEVLPEYKAHRKEQRKPIGLAKARKLIEKKFKCVIKPEMEADDVLGILSTASEKVSGIKGIKIIISIDKDFQSIPGYFYNPNTDDKYVNKISLEEADKFFYTQVLVGDTADNYDGCPKIGAVTAKKVLDKSDNLWYDVVKCFEEKGLPESDAIQQARCARILRASDYDFKKGKIKLWTPK